MQEAVNVMQICPAVEKALRQQGVAFELIPHPPTRTLDEAATAIGVTPDRLARAVVLRGQAQLLLAVVRADQLIDFARLDQLFGWHVEPATQAEVRELFKGCEAGSVPPLAEPFGLKAVVDEALFENKEIYFEPGSRSALVRITARGFKTLHGRSVRAPIARAADELSSLSGYEFVMPEGMENEKSISNLKPVEDLEHRAARLKQLPAMPDMAARLLELSNNPRATVGELVAIVEKDPSLAAQIVRYAGSAFFAYRGRIESIGDAITRVLGFEVVLNLALGFAAGRAFNGPSDGPVGLISVWRHAVYSAALAQTLCPLVPRTLRPKPGLAYLGGLLHNFGYLVHGHLYKPQMFLLNRVIAANPGVPLPLIEKRILGVTHTETGAWLMEQWGLPAEIVVTMREHHNETYAGPHAVYVHLIHLSDRLLKGQDIGDAVNADPPPMVISALGLSPEVAQETTMRIMAARDGLDAMTRQLAAS